MKLSIALFLGLAGVALAAPHGVPGRPLAPDLRNLDQKSMVTVLIQFNGVPSNQTLKNIGVRGVLKKQFRRFPAQVITVPANALESISKLPGVKYVSPDRSLRGKLDLTTATAGADVARQYGWTGKGVGVAVLDSGITPGIPDFNQANSTASRVLYSENFIGLGAGDLYGHGTHVAGIIGGNGAGSTGIGFLRTFRGVAPDVNLVNLRVLDENGVGSDSAVISAIERAIDLQGTYNIRVINLSLGRPIFESYATDPLCQAVEMAWKAGIVVVVAAGNNGRDNSVGNQGYGTIMSPANDPYVITVGAMKSENTPLRTDDLIASYSSKGPTIGDHFVKPDLVAPGNKVISLRAPGSYLDSAFAANQTLPTLYGGLLGMAPVYFSMSGTSMAAPVVSGAAALLLQKDPTLTPDQVKARLMKTASKSFPSYSTTLDPVTGVAYTSQYDIFTVGAGYLDITAALNNIERPFGRAVSPWAVYDSVTKKINILTGDSIAWGESVAWGDSIAWGDSVAWGDSTTQAFTSIWSSSVAWGDSTVASENASMSGEK